MFSAPPSVGYAGASLAGGSVCNLSFDRTSCSVSVTTASTALTGVVTLTPNGVDIPASVTAGTPVNVTITSSPAITVSVTAQMIAQVGRIIVGVAAQPLIYINYNDQSTGMITLTEQGPGFFVAGLSGINTFGLCTVTGEAFTRAPWAVVTAGDLKLLNGLVGGTSVIGTLTSDAASDGGVADSSCAYWTVYSGSTVASTIEIRGSDSAGVVLPSGALNGPRLSVPASAVPGTTQLAVNVGTVAGLTDDTGGNAINLVSNATRAYKSGVVVAAVAQPAIPAGTADSLAGNLTISETLNGQFKPNQFVCVTILPRAANSVRTQDTFIKSTTTNDLPVITTNSASGLLASSVAVPGCPVQFNTSSFTTAPTPGASFSFSVNQQSFGGTLGMITISNIHLITTADAASGPVLVDVMGDNGGGGVQFESVVSNARIGAAINGVAGSAKGITKAGPFTAATKVSPKGKYFTYRFNMGSAEAGKLIQIWSTTKTGADWAPWHVVTSRIANASGSVYYYVKSAAAAWKSFRAISADMSTTTSGHQVRWI